MEENETKPSVSAALARRVLLQRQGLADAPGRKIDAGGVRELIERMGFVQVDSISTVERAHHMILFARSQTYRPDLLHRLLERERHLFENWTHDAAVIPTRFYPVWRRKFARDRDRLVERWRTWRREGFEERLDDVLAHVERNGPVMAREMTTEKRPGGAWWDWHPSKTALEYLWRTGDLAICHRRGFQKAYDLSERVIPAEHRADAPDHDSWVDWLCRGALERLGVATPGELAQFWGLASVEEAKTWASGPAGRGFPRVMVNAVDGSRPREALADPAILDMHADDIALPPRLRILSPFDPVLRDRRRALRLFGFDYRIEVFVPAAKRRYGYYVFPMLEGDRLVGRIDMKREDGALAVRQIWWEPGVRASSGRRQRLEAELDRVRRFIGADRIVFAPGSDSPG
ncbi:MAG: hypothetical protein TEF_17880 [Rhizobiales bacterium NRL2]|jgi:hypothetical protein|nr:MAG: hypothetical protein TEF_17880 [Rhizobiales bacterium NRL2]